MSSESFETDPLDPSKEFSVDDLSHQERGNLFEEAIASHSDSTIEFHSTRSAPLLIQDPALRKLLFDRIKSISWLMLCFFLLYAVRAFLMVDHPWDLKVMALLGCLAPFIMILLLRNYLRATVQQLRKIEWVGLWSLTLFFLRYESIFIERWVEAKDPLLMVAGISHFTQGWLLMLVIYGLMIPNTWQRVLMISMPLFLGPILLVVYQRAEHPMLAQYVNVEEWSLMVIMLSFGYLCSGTGAHMIHTLKTKVDLARKFGPYQLKHLMGKGGMGEVYLGEHTLLKRRCAIKLIRKERRFDDDMLARFELEVRSMAELTHWNTVQIFDYGQTEDGTFYYVMELLFGVDLHSLVEKEGPQPEGRVIHILVQLCDALAEAHGKGFLHRDIKPGNVMLVTQGGKKEVVKLLDFGLVTVFHQPATDGKKLSGYIAGTPDFMSPEQARAAGKLDGRSDLYALGALGYFLLTGKPPFLRATVADARWSG